ncbi:hypothetical protein NC653_005025 [Populus alba x Populus x berolinensis]|uniref:Uncharacterized protein n=1 Tax=Populus alba x Populus x berolinensis TaxID=444605 RepID=A0AAD6RC77_9ROSI|nr:hypothetical protein NC653_005025 [Populus alba x Populus x berolinensis]
MPCGLLLQAPVLWFSGLPGPPDDSLRVPRDGGLLTPVDPPVGGSFDVADEGSMWFADFDTLRPSAMKLLTTTCNEIDGSISLAGRLTNAEYMNGKKSRIQVECQLAQVCAKVI